MEYTGRLFFKASIKEATQADGNQEFDVSDSLYVGNVAKRHWQLQLIVSATPETGSLVVSGRIPGSDEYTDLFTLDMTDGDQEKQFTGAYAKFRAAPSGFDSDKTYDIFLAAT